MSKNIHPEPLNLNSEFIGDLLDHLHVNFFIIDEQGQYLCKNNAMAQIIKDATWANKVDVKSWKACQQVISTGKLQITEEKYKGKSYLAIKAATEMNGNKAVIGISIDITDRKRAEELQKEKELAEKTASYMEGIAGSLAHELRTPLAIINSHIDLLNCIMSSDKTDEKEKKSFFRKTVDVIKQTVTAGNNLITNILLKLRSLARGEVDKRDFRRNSIVNDINDLLATYPFENDEKDLVEFNYHNDFTYFGSETLTRHVFYNLLKNALRAIKESDKGKITIELEEDSDSNFNKLILTDTGSGIAQEFLPKIFTQFETEEKNGKGSGLGLSFCKLVMESYGGDITCNSKEGKYTEFVLRFPKVSAEDPATNSNSKEYFLH